MNRVDFRFHLFLTVILFACSTNSPELQDGTFQYKLNGQRVTIKHISGSFGSLEYAQFTKQLAGTNLNIGGGFGGIISRTRYVFNGQNGPNTNNSFSFGILSDSLAIGSYTQDSTYSGNLSTYTALAYNGQVSGILFTGDYFSVNITSYSNGFISGNFTAKLTPIPVALIGVTPIDHRTRGTTVVTEGEFKNITCRY